MKKYLLLVEDEKLWEKFKEIIQQDINTEVLKLIKEKVEGMHRSVSSKTLNAGGKNGK